MSKAFITPFKLSAISIAVLMASNAIGQTQEQKDTQSIATIQAESTEVSGIEVIEITGLKSSLKKSINDKRFSQNLVDTINAEDIGKSTDQNVADALSRVTGVSLVTRDGEGTQITVRGATANQNNITINGQQLTSTDFSQAVDLSSFSADILSKLEVVKTSSADQDEGSLGANINLITLKPLEQKKDVRSFTAQGRYNDFSEESDHKVQFTLTEKFFDDTFGVAFSVYDETTSIRRDQYRVDRFEASTIIDSASDLNGEAISGVKAIRPTATRYELHQNNTERQGLTLGLQFLPDDVSEMTLDITYSTQEYATRQDAVISRFTNNENFVEGVKPLGELRPAAPFTDPQRDWYVVDTDTNTLVKQLNRFGAGDLQASQGGNDQKNGSVSFTYKRELTDEFRMSSQIGYSKSESESLPSAFAALQNFPQVPAVKLYDAGRDVEPVGYDCTSGTCRMVVGSSLVDLGEQIVNEVDPDTGIFTPGYDDNIVLTGYNPTDINTQHLSFLSENDVNVSDELANAQFDFEYDYEGFGFTSFEFGGKATKRTKDVDNQQYRFNSVTATDVIEDEFGNPVAIPGGSLLDIRATLIAREGVLPSDFMQSLGYGRNEATQGWTQVDATKAINLLLDDENTVRTPNDSESRITDIDTQAFYVKGNFDLFDGRLTGNIGLRYVKTDITAEGYSGADFWQFSETLEREFDRVNIRDLRDTSLPECRAPIFADPNQPKGYEQKYQRVDGQGWDTSSGPDPSGWTRIADQGPCHDPAFAQWAAFQQDPSLPEPAEPITWLNMWRYADVATTRNNGWNGDIVYDGTTPLSPVNANQFSATSERNRELQSFRSSDKHSYTNLLPSLNLNYAISDEMVGRFSVSKTMTRPEIDQLRPGFQLTENGYWGSGNPSTGSKVSLFNTQLEPLESKNLDVSFEWYFNETSMLSVAVFHKNMSNFTTVENAVTYLQDVRNVDTPVSGSEIILLAEDDGTNDQGLNGCMPLRATADYGWWNSDPTRFSDNLRDLCAQYSVSKIVNGKGAKITGLELGYVQTYDFLPGFLSGLGVSANYTYQDSQYDPDRSSIDPSKTLPSFPVADTPEHSYNATIFWEQDGHQIRLAYRGTSDSLVGTDYNTGLQGRTWNQGSLWNGGRGNLDLSASYKLNDNVTFSLQAINLLDDEFRTYYTSRELEVDRIFADNDVGYQFVAFEEGNPLDGDATRSRTYTRYKVGTTYRLGVNVTF
tara:strand:+ start:959 stop:4627 length:3669 start_codon:yes stop_codon:yes gene_type:complete